MSNSFINSEKNDNFAVLRGIDLQNLLVETENYFLEYRDKLNLPSNITFGVELEYEKLFKRKTDKFIKNNLPDWKSKSDGSLNSGGEITSPIMKDNPKYWQELKKVCEFLSKKRADTSNNAGGHVHIGANVLGEDVEAWKIFLKLYTNYENIIFRFAYGDKINGRKNIYKYAPPTADYLKEIITKIDEAESLFHIYLNLPTKEKYSALNFCNVGFNSPIHKINTLEFRSPNASSNAIIWQNNINAFTKMLISSKDKKIDSEFLDYKLNHEYFPYLGNEYLYNEVNLKKVLEFVDLIFDNNLDKIYFLRQYLKGFQDGYRTVTTLKAKKFVK